MGRVLCLREGSGSIEAGGKRQEGYTCGPESLRFHLDGLLCKAAERGGGRSYV